MPPFVVIGDPRALSAVWDGPIATVDDPRDADTAFDVGLPLIVVPATGTDIPGQPSVAGAHAALDALFNKILECRTAVLRDACLGWFCSCDF